MRKWKVYLIVLVGLGCLTILGCSSLMDSITPTRIAADAITYTGMDANDLGNVFHYTSLMDAKDVRNNIVVTHRTSQLDFKRAIEDDNLAFNDALALTNMYITEAEEWRALIIGSNEQPFSVLGVLAGLGFGGVGTIIGGRYIKRKKDFTPSEHTAELATAYEAGLSEGMNGKTEKKSV